MNQKTKAILFMLASALAFSLAAMFVKLTANIPIAEKMFFRNIITLAILLLIFRNKTNSIRGQKEHRIYLVLRGILGAIGMVFYFYTVTHMYLADAAMLSGMTPFVTTLLAWIFLKEKIPGIQIPALIIVFLASMLIVKPQFNMSVLPAVAGLLSAITTGSAYTSLRYLNGKESPETIVFYFALISTLISIPPMCLNFVMPTGIEWVYLLAIGILATIGQFCLTLAYKFGRASEVAIYSYTSILFSAVLGFIFWSEVSDAWTITGGAIIISVSYFMYLYQNKNLLRVVKIAFKPNKYSAKKP